MPADWPIVLVADDTVERRHGRKIKAKGCYRDAVRSSRKVVVKCFGLKWVAMMVLVQLPWNKHVKALPFLTVLGWPESAPRRRAHKTSIDCVKQMVLQVRRWFPQRRVVLVLDGGFAAVKLARACRRHGVTMICRLRLDAGLYDPPGEQPTSKRGPKPKKDRARSSSRSGPGVKTPPGRIARSSGMVANGSRCGCSRGRGCGTRPVKIRWRSASASASVFGQRGASPLQARALRPVTDGNCVLARGGGKQPEVNDQSVTRVNSIRPYRAASLLGKGEARTGATRKSTTLRGSV